MKNFSFFFLFSLLVTSAFSQETEDLLSDEDEIIDAVLGEQSVEEFLISTTNFHFIHFSVGYNNQTYFSGRDIGIDQFNISPQITYINSKGFFGGITGVYFSEFDPKWDFTAVTVGYRKAFKKHQQFSWSTSYARYFYEDTTQDNPFTNTLSFDLEFDNKKKTFGTEISTSFLFGSDTSFQLISSTYGLLKVLKTKNHYLKLRPQLSFIIAQQTIQLTQGFPTEAKLPPPKFPPLQQENYSFGLLNTQLQIPLQYTYSNFEFELGYTINFPSKTLGETDLKTTSNFNISLSYLFGL